MVVDGVKFKRIDYLRSISIILYDRTQNSIKNQFYSLIRCSIKILTKVYKPKLLKITNRLTPLDLFEIYIDQTVIYFLFLV